MTANDIKALFVRLRHSADGETLPLGYTRGTVAAFSDDIRNAAAALETLTLENQRLRVDAERWREFATFGNPVGEPIRHEIRYDTSTRSEVLGSTANSMCQIHRWVLREVKFRWWAKEGEKLTLLDVIDADRKN